MAASNKRKQAASPTPRQRRFGDKIALHHCNDEKKFSRRKTLKAVNAKSKFSTRKRKVSSPSQKENQYAVAFIPECGSAHNSIEDPNVCPELPFLNGTKQLQLPEVKMVGRLSALRSQPRLTDERVDVDTYVKRHEKLEKEEKQLLRRDRIWQNEVRYRSRLLGIQQTPPPLRDFRIVVMRKARIIK
ncbi:hypothetical protein NECAME_02542 [Necator americanus]|uniref:PEHE domain-containing protein n=1 Tax=Necator americanus TaxID=51031 RepID=W2TDP8_NECAM|nr:hypothetical protein NECAME_02542 [Necator americanus]ETN79719.1 hypothetical protein NECAME_02542 [Necator americanus]